MSCDPQTLVTQAVCIDCNIPKGMQMAVLISLFCQILDNGGGGGGGGSGFVLQGTVDPVAAPSDPNSPAIYTNTVSGTIFTWDATNHVWI